MSNKQKEDTVTFCGGIVVMGMGMFALYLERGWLINITGILFILFGVGLISTKWGTNEK